MERTEQGNMMKRGTFDALRNVGFDEKQAVVLATAIPDVERPIADLRNELIELELKFVTGLRTRPGGWPA